jgi:hypothetical protein
VVFFFFPEKKKQKVSFFKIPNDAPSKT